MATVIPARHLTHRASGKAISLFSVLPFGTREDWDVVTDGYTIEWPDGTTGCGRPPFKTAEEAQAFIDRNPRFGGMNAY